MLIVLTKISEIFAKRKRSHFGEIIIPDNLEKLNDYIKNIEFGIIFLLKMLYLSKFIKTFLKKIHNFDQKFLKNARNPNKNNRKK